MRTVRITRANWLNDWIGGDAGAVRFLDDQQAYEAVEVYRLAVYIDGGQGRFAESPSAVPVVKIEPGLEFPEEPVSEEFRQQLAESMDHIEAVADGRPEDSPLAEPKMPWSNASKAAWIDWAVHQGADPEQAAAMSKNALMSRYGERL